MAALPPLAWIAICLIGVIFSLAVLSTLAAGVRDGVANHQLQIRVVRLQNALCLDEGGEVIIVDEALEADDPPATFLERQAA